MVSSGYLTPFIPLSFKGEGELEKEGLAPLLDTSLGWWVGIDK